MENKFTIIWSFRNRLEEFKESLLSADKTCSKDIDFCLVDASSDDGNIRELRHFCNGIQNRIIRICESTYRSSLAEAWNLGMMVTNNRYVIFCSSDTKFINPGWYEVLYDSIVNKKNKYVLLPNHSVFGLDKTIINDIGWFDELFINGPHFDVDYMIRASEKGIGIPILNNDNYYTHTGLSGTYAERIKHPPKDYLPMDDFTNEHIFKDKWATNWPGWEVVLKNNLGDAPHPPTHISQVQRKRGEVNPHPLYTKKYKI